jgi:IclR family transcriptional regulator, acetate operon repressor
MTSGESRPTRNSGVQSIDRAAAILRSFAAHPGELTLSEIARATGLTTSTAHRLLASMQSNQLVRQTQGRRYAPGQLLVQLVRRGAVSTSLRDAVVPVMVALRDEVEETIGLHTLTQSDERVVVDQVESHHALRRTYTEIGVPIPLPYGAPGKVLTAWLPRKRRENVLNHELSQLTPNTVIDPAVLRSQLDETVRRGFAVSYAERTPGIRSVAAPVFDHHGSITGCLSVSGPELRMPAERLQELGVAVRRAAHVASEALGATPATIGARSKENAVGGE